MIIFNTTYHVDNLVLDEFISFLRNEFIPEATNGGEMIHPRLAKILSHQEEGTSLALQFEVAAPEKLDDWYDQAGDDLNERMVARFGSKVVGFSTLMEEIEL